MDGFYFRFVFPGLARSADGPSPVAGLNHLPQDRTFRLQALAPARGHVLQLRGDLDLAVWERMGRTLRSLPDSRAPLVVDLTEATYLDCATLRLLLAACRVLRATRPVSFRVAAAGKVRHLIGRLALEEELGLLAAPPPPSGTRPRTCSRHRGRAAWAARADVLTGPERAPGLGASQESAKKKTPGCQPGALTGV